MRMHTGEFDLAARHQERLTPAKNHTENPVPDEEGDEDTPDPAPQPLAQQNSLCPQ
jgi:hypothetical protein